MSNVVNLVQNQEAMQEAAEKHYRRHAKPGNSTIFLTNGLTLTQNEDGLWLNFKSGDGKQASVHMDMIGPHDSKSAVRAAIDAWQADYAAWKDH